MTWIGAGDAMLLESLLLSDPGSSQSQVVSLGA